MLILSARVNDPSDSDWVRTGAGLLVNHKYGFGLVDVSQAVMLANRSRASLPPVLNPFVATLEFREPVVRIHTAHLGKSVRQEKCVTPMRGFYLCVAGCP